MSVTAILAPAIKTFTAAATTHVNTSSFDTVNVVNTSAPAAEEESNSGGRLALLYKLKQERLSNLKPVSEFFDRNRFNYTTSIQLISQRWNYNLQYFSSNYFLIMLGLAFYSILTNWWLLFTIGFIFGGFYLISKLGKQEGGGPINVAGIMTLSAPALYATYAVGSLVLLLFSGATGAIFWIIGASALLILGHAALMEPGIEEGFADSQV